MQMKRRFFAAWIGLAVASAGCVENPLRLGPDSGGDATPAQEQQAATLRAIEVSPAVATLSVGQSLTFVAQGRDTQGGSVAVSPSWTATGGSISKEGVYTATETGGPYTITASVAAIAGSASVTVTAPIPPVSYPEVAFDDTQVNAALSDPLLDVGVTWSGASRWVRLFYLATVARLSDQPLLREQAANRVAKHLTNFVSDATTISGGAGGIFGGHWDHVRVPNIAFTIALARHTTSIWQQLSGATRERLDTWMRIVTYAGNMWCNPAHNGSGNRLMLYPAEGSGYANPNQRPHYMYLSAAWVYWGGLGAINAELAAFDPAALKSAMESYGWAGSQLHDVWTSKALMASCDSGADLRQDSVTPGATGVNHYSSKGVREPLATFTGYVQSDPDSSTGYTAGNALPLTPRNLMRREQVDNMFCKTVKDEGCGNTDLCGQFGHLYPGLTSPHLGQHCMPHEYNIGARSSGHYVATGIAQSVPHIVFTLMTGHWPSPHTELDPMLQQIRCGIEVWLYRDVTAQPGGAWFDNGSKALCKYDSLATYFLSTVGLDLIDKVLMPAHHWPEAPVGGGS